MSTTFGTKQISADQHASLTAPPRDRAISVDDFIEQPAPADSESDSDADENEPSATPAQKRSHSALRRSNSSLSFESDPDADAADPPAKKQRPDRQHPTPTPSPSESDPRRSQTLSLLVISPVPPAQRAHLTGPPSLSPSASYTNSCFTPRQAQSQSAALSQPFTSPTNHHVPSPPIVSSVARPTPPNAPPLAIDPSVPPLTTPPRPTLSLPLPAAKSPAASPNSLNHKFSNAPFVSFSVPTALIPSPPVSASPPAVPGTSTAAVTPTSPNVSRALLAAKPASPTVHNLVPSHPEPSAPALNFLTLPASQAQPSPLARPSSAVLEASSPWAAHRPFLRQHAAAKLPGIRQQTTPRPPAPVRASVPSPQISVVPPMHAQAQTETPPTAAALAPKDVETTPMQTEFPPLSHEELVNIRQPKPSDGGDWDRFVFFKHRPRRHDFGKNCYLSDYSPFAALAPAVANEPPSTICAVCGGGYNLIPCNGCVCAFHEKCMTPYPVTGSPWYCKGCRSAGLPDSNPAHIPESPTNVSKAAQALHRPIIDAKEGNPIDLVLHPSLMTLFRENYGGYDWLQCYNCERRRLVPNGILCESVEIPFECEGMFWLPEKERNCSSHSDPSTQKVEKYINRQAALRKDRRKTVLEMFGDGSDDDSDVSLRADPDNVKLTVTPPARPPQQSPSPVPKLGAIPNGTCAQHAAPKSACSPQVNSNRAAERKQAVAETRPPPTPGMADGFAPMEVDTVGAGRSSRSRADLAQTGNAVTNATPPRPSETPSERNMSRPATATTAVTVADAVTASTTAKTKSETTKQEDKLGSTGLRPEDVQQDLLVYIAELELDEPTEDILTDLALTNNKALAQIYIAFRSNKDRFKRQAVRIAKREAKPS